MFQRTFTTNAYTELCTVLSVCNFLSIDAIESLVIAYTSNEGSEDLLESLKRLWTGIEEYVKIGKLSSVGLSDLNTNVFIDLFQWANVKFIIIYVLLEWLKLYCCVYLKFCLFISIDKTKYCTN